jgi:hypothetical protein
LGLEELIELSMRRESRPRFHRSDWDVTVMDTVDAEASALIPALPIPVDRDTFVKISEART